MLRIALTGPESSGKTTLSTSISEHYGVSFVAEYARMYLENNKGLYEQKDLDCIAQGQLERILSSKEEIVISDTDFSVLEVWSQYKYGEVSAVINEYSRQDLFDLHILCCPDIPWEEDSLRENPTSRNELFERYKESLLKHNKRSIIVAGPHEARLKKSLQSIDALLKF